MIEDVVVRYTRQALMLVLMVSAPPLLTALAVGVVISIFQAATQIQEQTLSYVPKIIAVFLVLMALMPWMIGRVVRFGVHVLSGIPFLIQ